MKVGSELSANAKKKKQTGLQSQLSLYNVKEVLVKDMVAAELCIHLFKCSFSWEQSTCISLAPNTFDKLSPLICQKEFK